MRYVLTAALFAALTVSAAAQTAITGQLPASDSSRSANPTTIYLNGSASTLAAESSCPVGFQAQLSTTPGTVIVDSGTHAPVSQQVQLTVRNPGGLGITSLRVIVHGLTPQPRNTPVVATSSGDSGTVNTPATLRIGVAPGGNGFAQLGVKGITSIRSIDLIQVTYVGGTLWEATPGHTCRIEPNRVMLVASH